MITKAPLSPYHRQLRDWLAGTGPTPDQPTGKTVRVFRKTTLEEQSGKVYEALKLNPKATIHDLQKATRLRAKTIWKAIARLQQEGKVKAARRSA